VIFRLTTIIPQTGIKIDHFARTRAVSYGYSPPVILLIFDYGIATGISINNLPLVDASDNIKQDIDMLCVKRVLKGDTCEMAELLDLLRVNYLSVLINVSSFAFQIAGAVLLLLWSIRKCDTKIKEQCLESGDILAFQFDETGVYTDISKDDLQAAAAVTYKNIAAFVNILIGYTCAVFSVETPLPRWSIFILVIALTAIILWLENVCVSCIARKRYPEDERVYEKRE